MTRCPRLGLEDTFGTEFAIGWLMLMRLARQA